MKHDYTKLDAAIIAALNVDKPTTFASLRGGAVFDESYRLEAAQPANHSKPAWRFLDSRLQALRKAGKIKYQRKSKAHAEGWVLGDKE